LVGLSYGIKKMLVIKFFLAFILFLVSSSTLLAEWMDQTTVISGRLGNKDDQFGLYFGSVPAYDELPGDYDISESGKIVLSDQYNGRFKIFDKDFELTAIVIPPVNNPSRWTISPRFVDDTISIILDRFYFYNSNGEIISEAESPKKARRDQDYGGNLYLYQDKPIGQWVSYSSTGELLNTFSEKPLILGHSNIELFAYDNKKRYRTTVQYTDTRWTIDGRKEDCFQRDIEGNLYCINSESKPFSVTRYNQCGKPVSELVLPQDDIDVVYLNVADIEGQWTVNSAYMNPKIDSYGNVYATRKTTTTYSLVKWAWHDTESDHNDGPDAPINLTADVHNGNSVELTWEGSLQDPGCVTGYRILRSETEGAEGVEIFTLDKGARKGYDIDIEVEKTYYYKIQALSDVVDSDLSTEAKVVIPAN
jgi:hypothetical protein